MGEKHKHSAEWAQLLVGVRGGRSWWVFVGGVCGAGALVVGVGELRNKKELR